MGRTLDSMDIHSPSLPTPTASSQTAQSLNVLLDEKIVLEGSLTQLGAVLDSHGVGIRQRQNHLTIDMTTPLIDRDGFPRADLDIAQSIAFLQND
jgi:26S proteasome regulatory subunit N4